MKILALELSSAVGSVAWLEEGHDPFSVTFASDRKHSGLFFANLERCLERFGHPERIVVGLGPGSYAGTRIAISTAVGLQAAAKAHLCGLPSFCAMVTDVSEYAVIGDARRQSFFFAQVCDHECAEGAVLATEAELRARLQTYPHPVFTAELLRAFPQADLNHPCALLLAELSRNVPTEGDGLPLEPIYLRGPHITQAKGSVLSA